MEQAKFQYVNLFQLLVDLEHRREDMKRQELGAREYLAFAMKKKGLTEVLFEYEGKRYVGKAIGDKAYFRPAKKIRRRV